MRPLLIGRKITCCMCGRKTVKGAARVCRKVLFQFCPLCWTRKNKECCAFMDGASRMEDA